MTQEANKPILDLSTTVERASIIIDGETYEIRDQKELELKEFHSLISTIKGIQRFFEKDDYSEKEVNRYKQKLEAVMSQIFVELPDYVLAKLHHRQRMQILTAFLAPMAAEMSSSDTEESPDSNDSTVEH